MKDTNEELFEYLNQPFKLKTVLNSLDFLETDVIQAAVSQPKLFREAARFRVAKMRDVSRAKAQYETIRSDAALKLRRKKETDKGLTEGAIKDRVDSNPDVLKAHAKLQRAYEAEEFAKLLLEAYRMRRDSLRIVTEANGAEVGREMKELRTMIETTGLKKVKSKLRARLNKQNNDEDIDI